MAMQTDHNRSIYRIWNLLALALAMIVFILDLSLPRGVMAGIPYFLVLWLTYFSRSPRSVALCVTVCVLLSVLGYIYSPANIAGSYSLFNRLASTIALGITGLFVYLAMKWQVRLVNEIASANTLAQELSQEYESSRAQSRALASVMEDLTKEREQLRASEELFRVTIEANPTSIIMTDEMGFIRMVNREAERVFGYFDQPLLGVNITSLIPEIEFKFETSGDGSDRILEPVNWNSFNHETIARRRNGEEIPVQMNTAFVRTTETLSVLISVIDISASKEHARKLQQARDTAEQASRARGEFLANVSHEIRTPITAILGYVDIIAERAEDPDNLQALEIIRSNGRHLLQLINDILDLSKIDAGKLFISNERAQLSEIFMEIHGLMHERASEKKLKLIFEFPAELPEEIETDTLRLRQILLNIIGNAIKFTPRGSVTVSTTYCQVSNRLQFEMADTGIGISQQDLHKLFQTFSQVDSSNTREYEGSGLGLVISRRLARALGGDLTVTSELGKGSVFTLTIPCGNVSKKRSRPTSETSSDSTYGPAPVELTIQGTILVVDDRRDIRFLAQHLIEKAGGNVMIATNGQEAIDLLTDNSSEKQGADLPLIDLVLMDMQMPVVDGYEATRVLRARGFTKPIIALTANAMVEDREKCLLAGCTDFITKPIDSRKLVSILNSVLAAASEVR